MQRLWYDILVVIAKPLNIKLAPQAPQLVKHKLETRVSPQWAAYLRYPQIWVSANKSSPHITFNNNAIWIHLNQPQWSSWQPQPSLSQPPSHLIFLIAASPSRPQREEKVEIPIPSCSIFLLLFAFVSFHWFHIEFNILTLTLQYFEQTIAPSKAAQYNWGAS